jgi:hypothetical protein
MQIVSLACPHCACRTSGIVIVDEEIVGDCVIRCDGCRKDSLWRDVDVSLFCTVCDLEFGDGMLVHDGYRCTCCAGVHEFIDGQCAFCDEHEFPCAENGEALDVLAA